MPRGYDAISGQLAFGEPAPPSPQARRALRRGPRTGRIGAAAAQSGPTDVPASPAARPLAEWHDMTPGERVVAWAALRAWVTWLNDRYELSSEERLPRCWPQHPGLVEELYALKAWREDIYTTGQPSGQAARYWHSELRQVLHAAATMYAGGCRAGHRSAPSLAADDPSLRKTWAAADPLARVPGTELEAGLRAQAGDGQWVSHAAMATAIDSGYAIQPGLGIPDAIMCSGRWGAPASAGWLPAGQPARTGPAPPRTLLLAPGRTPPEGELTTNEPDPPSRERAAGRAAHRSADQTPDRAGRGRALRQPAAPADPQCPRATREEHVRGMGRLGCRRTRRTPAHEASPETSTCKTSWMPARTHPTRASTPGW